RETGVRLVQLRNLNIDPEVFWPRVPRPDGRPLGVRTFIETLRREVPNVTIGNFSRPIGMRALRAGTEGKSEIGLTPPPSR
ncbi:MAG: hypothetical protein ACM3N4_04705, partial [Nitrososphaerota archaeon]